MLPSSGNLQNQKTGAALDPRFRLCSSRTGYFSKVAGHEMGMAAMGMAFAPARGFYDIPGGREPKNVPIYRLLQQSAFGPEEIDRLAAAFEESLRALQLQDRSDPLSETIAKKLIEIAQTGERDPRLLRKRAFEALDLPTAD
ncbi:MAG TPA: hypothetical protein VL048_18945 [Xanthobacteraceae bacterium]|nr:hypothetical protein [Xanthobacteraceae bacterium]